jgi:hypothetical protein
MGDVILRNMPKRHRSDQTDARGKNTAGTGNLAIGDLERRLREELARVEARRAELLADLETVAKVKNVAARAASASDRPQTSVIPAAHETPHARALRPGKVPARVVELLDAHPERAFRATEIRALIFPDDENDPEKRTTNDNNVRKALSQLTHAARPVIRACGERGNGFYQSVKTMPQNSNREGSR